MGIAIMGRLGKMPPPTVHVPVPLGPLESVQITLDRSGCYGTCPIYDVTIRGDGTVAYSGGSFVLVEGEHRAATSKATVQCLLDAFRAADFWSFAPNYEAPITDSATYKLKLSIGGQQKEVVDYVGEAIGMPKAVTELERLVDAAASTSFVRGDQSTIAVLEAENFDFHSAEAGTLLVRAVQYAPDEVVLGLLAKGSPVDAREPSPFSDDPGPTAIEVAAQYGRTGVFQALMQAGAGKSLSSEVINNMLRLAAASGNPSTVAEVLKLKPDPNARDEDGDTPLILVWRAQHSRAPKDQIDLPGVIKLLLGAGADPKLANPDGETALHFASGAEPVRLLLAAGAPLEAKDKEGRTPVLTADNDDAALTLLEAGARPNAVAKNGETVVKVAAEYNYAKTLAYLAKHGFHPPLAQRLLRPKSGRGFRRHLYDPIPGSAP